MKYKEKNLENKHHVVGVFIGLSKAFDFFTPWKLHDKLKYIGIRVVTLELLQSCITSR